MPLSERSPQDQPHNTPVTAGLSAAAGDGGLVDFIAKVAGEDSLRVEESFGQGFVRLRVAEAERRQAKHDIRCVEDIVIELLRNARDAGARRVFLATARRGDERSLVVLDDGSGIPANMHKKIFDARVTSKLTSVHMDHWGVHGRGMALYSIAQNVSSARVCASKPGCGTSIAVTVDCTKLAERDDQSTLPDLEPGKDGILIVARGPHNIPRTAAEFALEERGGVEVWLGTPSQIAATLRALFKDSPGEGVCAGPAAAATAQQLALVCQGLGLDLSLRNAHRVMAGEIPVQPPLLDTLLATVDDGALQEPRVPGGKEGAGQSPLDLVRDRRGLRLDKADVDAFADRVAKAFSELSAGYYLTDVSAPRVSVHANKISVTIEFGKED